LPAVGGYCFAQLKAETRRVAFIAFVTSKSEPTAKNATPADVRADVIACAIWPQNIVTTSFTAE
jgi:hypothetical protein